MPHRGTQGLCFNCNEKFTASHKCTKAQLLLLESEELPDEAVHEEIMGEEITREPGESVNPIISLYALTGWAAPQTMHVMARIGPYKIIVLIDSESTHNFISTKLANMLQLLIKPTTAFTVRVANGENLICQGKFEKVHILIQYVPFSLTVYSLPISGLDMVLGVQWLELLGLVVCNWKALTMVFEWGNEKRCLQGICN